MNVQNDTEFDFKKGQLLNIITIKNVFAYIYFFNEEKGVLMCPHPTLKKQYK